jgi:hypothetical protein
MSPMAIVLFVCLAAGAVILSMAVVLTPPLARRQFGQQLLLHAEDLTAVDTDAYTPPRGGYRPDAITLQTIQYGAQDWDRDFLQTFTAPVLAIMRVRENTNLEMARGYVVPSVYTWLARQPEIFAGVYTMFFLTEASVSEFQVVDISVTGDHMDETWTLLRRRNPINCRTCGGSVSGVSGGPCRACHSPCTGFEAGWRVLEIRRS